MQTVKFEIRHKIIFSKCIILIILAVEINPNERKEVTAVKFPETDCVHPARIILSFPSFDLMHKD
jgi:hypothetical protein